MSNPVYRSDVAGTANWVVRKGDTTVFDFRFPAGTIMTGRTFAFFVRNENGTDPDVSPSITITGTAVKVSINSAVLQPTGRPAADGRPQAYRYYLRETTGGSLTTLVTGNLQVND